jgi:catechol 2,3-dioxygenase-like lactoylglutathione lyase family enzyme
MTDTTAAINATNLGCSITCKDLQASIRFYRDGIGFAVGETYENEGKVVAAVVSAGDCRIVLNQDDGKLGWDRIKGQGFYLQINVAAPADVDAAAARIRAAGGKLIDEPADRYWGAGCSSSMTWTDSSSACPRRSRDSSTTLSSAR